MKTLEQPKIERRGSCRWVSGNAKLALACGGVAALRITTETKKGPVAQVYLVRCEREGERVIGYSLERCDTGEHYGIDVSFGAEREHWVCDCPDSLYRAGPGGCKHCMGLHAALEAIGL